MVALLPTEILQTVTRRFPCRFSPIRELATYYNGILPSPAVLVAYGLEQSSKLEIIISLLEARSIRHAVIKSKDCLSQRHLISKVFSTCARELGDAEGVEQYDKIDSINALAVNLQRLLERSDRSLVLVLDGIDRQKGAGPTLLPALARLGDQIPKLSVVMTSNSPLPLNLHKSGVPYVHFGPYSRAEAVHLVIESPLALKPESLPAGTKVINAELLKIYAQFAAAVYDALVFPTASTSITTFRHLCEKLWPRFIWPLFSGEAPPGKAAGWDFSRLIVRNRSLFLADGEAALADRLQVKSGAWTFDDLRKTLEQETPNNETAATSSVRPSTSSKSSSNFDQSKSQSYNPPLLKHFSTLLLVAAYLASYTHQKHDIILFSRISSSSSKKVRKISQKKKLFQSPSKGSKGEGSATPTKSSRSIFDTKMGVARPFGLERLVAILRAIHPDGVSSRRGAGDRVYRELGELERLRLVVRAGGGGEDPEEKWKINVNRDWVVGMGKVWGMGVSEYEMDQD